MVLDRASVRGVRGAQRARARDGARRALFRGDIEREISRASFGARQMVSAAKRRKHVAGRLSWDECPSHARGESDAAESRRAWSRRARRKRWKRWKRWTRRAARRIESRQPIRRGERSSGKNLEVARRLIISITTQRNKTMAWERARVTPAAAASAFARIKNV